MPIASTVGPQIEMRKKALKKAQTVALAALSVAGMAYERSPAAS